MLLGFALRVLDFVVHLLVLHLLWILISPHDKFEIEIEGVQRFEDEGVPVRKNIWTPR